ncbi:MAG: hypothetical protein R3256_04980 [Thalassovita sp.]|nr:hypothetical protein [Thalassovita sp.]
MWTHHKPTLFVLVLALLAVLFFSTRFVVHWVYWNDQRHLNPDIEAWMTVGYVARAWHTPPETLAELIGKPEDIRRKTLEEIARDQNRPVADVIADLTGFLQRSAK